ncbi:hypothetical protein O6H91_04G123200 [Diphasiastrum complanatum]|uniref:Uncharacterized protein n=1 Tax=Diphasiastrum complanatum TaxID=34168 RepID=A0ACC2E1E9_DIPCM|nr:hypothetical protein O6H91_Y341600 [Diphasiastrum complanatum]KAJ7560306.1 hypothetical protein O6H91_04G123200 [Diphasiastrum complanatum]
MYTHILISAHGAQLTDSIFMNPRSQGWLELAGGGQCIYRNLAEWVGLQHEGYWRDPYTPDCPKPNDPVQCFSFCKDQKLGINATRIGEWLDQVIQDLSQKQEELLADGGQDKSKTPWDSPTCTCISSRAQPFSFIC